jgi:hypothetical protein
VRDWVGFYGDEDSRRPGQAIGLEAHSGAGGSASRSTADRLSGLLPCYYRDRRRREVLALSVRVWRRKPFAMTRAAALTMAGFLLYPIANIYPMSEFSSRLVHTSHTIFYWHNGSRKCRALAACLSRVRGQHRHPFPKIGGYGLVPDLENQD